MSSCLLFHLTCTREIQVKPRGTKKKGGAAFVGYNSAYCCGVLRIPKSLKGRSHEGACSTKIPVVVREAGSFPKEGAFAVGAASPVPPP